MLFTIISINCESVCLYKYSDEKIARVLGHVLMAFTITVMTTMQADQIPGRYWSCHIEGKDRDLSNTHQSKSRNEVNPEEQEVGRQDEQLEPGNVRQFMFLKVK